MKLKKNKNKKKRKSYLEKETKKDFKYAVEKVEKLKYRSYEV